MELHGELNSQHNQTDYIFCQRAYLTKIAHQYRLQPECITGIKVGSCFVSKPMYPDPRVIQIEGPNFEL